MKKKIIVAAVAAAVAAPLVAMADATVYGKVKVATQKHDRSGLPDSWGLQDHSSRIGIKGSEDLGNGLKAVYKMEFGSNVGRGAEQGFNWSQRNSYVGLAGGFGTFLMGRHDTPLKMSNGKLDFFGDTAADFDGSVASGGGVGLFASRRASGVLAYISPSFSGLTFAGAAVQTSDEGTDDFQDAYSLAAMYSNGPIFASLAYEELDQDLTGGADDEEQWRLGLGLLGMANFSAALNYETRDNRGGVRNNDSDAWQLQLAYDMGNNRIKAMYGDYDDDNAGGDFDTWAIGLQHNFSKRTDAQVLYRTVDFDDIGIEDDVIAFQLNHSF